MQKLIRFWQNLRLRAKFLLILLVGIVPVGIVAIVTLYIPLRAYDRQLYKSSAQMISLFAEQIQDELMNFEDISYRILTDTALQENLSIMKEAAPGTLTWINAQTKVANRVAYYSLWFSNAVSFQLKTSRGNSYNHFFEVSAGSDELTEERITAAVNHRGRFVWLTEEGAQTRLFLVREIREMQDMDLDTLGCLLIEVDFPALVEQYNHSMAQMGVMPRCAVYNDGLCLYASDAAIQTLGVGEDGYTYMKLDGQPMLCVRYTSSNGIWFVLMVVTMMLPGQVMMIPRFVLFNSMGWVGTYLPMIVPSFFASGFNIFLIMQFIRGIPRDMDEAAKIDGCSWYGVFFRIIVPMIVPSLVTVAVLTFMSSWEDFMGALLYLNKPETYTVAYALKMFNDSSMSDYGATFAMSAASLVPILVLFFFFQKNLVEGISIQGLKG